jgi:hypothetical protein
MNSVLYNGKMRVEKKTKLDSENTRVCAQTSIKKLFKNSASVLAAFTYC